MKTLSIFTLGVTTLLTLTVQASQEQLAASIRQAREEATVTSAQLNSTLAALNTLVSQTKGDLAPTYQAFRAEIPKTHAAALTTKTRVERMAREREVYFRTWQDAVNGISNPSLQRKAQKRLDAAAAKYSKVETKLATASEKFRPFLSDLADVEKALSQDVTPAGVKSMKGVTRKANWDYNSVAGAINGALKEMQKMEESLSAQAG